MTPVGYTSPEYAYAVGIVGLAGVATVLACTVAYAMAIFNGVTLRDAARALGPPAVTGAAGMLMSAWAAGNPSSVAVSAMLTVWLTRQWWSAR